MADFCKQCSLNLFDKDYRDMAGLISKAEVEKGLGAPVLCEGCGPILVDQDGRCMGGCLADHSTEDGGSK